MLKYPWFKSKETFLYLNAYHVACTKIAMLSEINAAIKQNNFQQVKTLVEAIIEEVSYTYAVSRNE